jgi:hypothetical protein
MVWVASPGAVATLRRIRFAMLALVALFLAHGAVFFAQYGPGDGFADAMREGGHDGYWPAYAAFAVAAGLTLVALSAFRVARLRRRLSATRSGRRPAGSPDPDGPSYPRELGGLWVRLFVVVAVAFAAQENLEHLSVAHHLLGLGALYGPEYPLAIPALLVVTFLLAAFGALVRWRLAVLRLCIARAAWRTPRWTRAHAARPVSGWWVAAAACAHHWTLARQDPGRAPPPSAAVA